MKAIQILLAAFIIVAIDSGIVAAQSHLGGLDITALLHDPPMTINPTSINLGNCPDNGIIHAVFTATSEGFNPTSIEGLNPGAVCGISDASKAPVFIPFREGGTNDPGSSNAVTVVPISCAIFSDANGDGILDTVKLEAKTCYGSPFFNGFTEVVQTLNLVDNNTVDIAVRGTQNVGSASAGFQQTDLNHRVVKVGG